MDYLTLIRNRGNDGEPGVPHHLGDKLVAREFVQNLGGLVPNLYAVVDSIDELKWEALPDRFVIKPTFLSSSYGVMVLERTSDGWYDHLRRRKLTTEEIVLEQHSWAEKDSTVRKRWIVEERIADVFGNEVPDDYKFFSFQGEIGLIHRTIRRPSKNLHAFFDENFDPIDDADDQLIVPNRKIIEKVVEPRPENWRALLNAASRFSTATPTPFVRVDMYDTHKGPIFGEFTLLPGTFYYEDREKMLPPLSYRLGDLWLEAQNRLS